MNKRDYRGMPLAPGTNRPPESKPVYLRTITKSGGSRYLSVGKILPPDWKNVKVTMTHVSTTGCFLLIVPIR